MRKTGLVLKMGAVSIVAAAGLAVTATPASALTACRSLEIRSDWAAAAMQEATSYEMWNAAYDLWLTLEGMLEELGC